MRRRHDVRSHGLSFGVDSVQIRNSDPDHKAETRFVSGRSGRHAVFGMVPAMQQVYSAELVPPKSKAPYINA